MPAPGACPSYRSHAASAFSSRNAESGSISRSMRSRAVSLPRSRWRASAFSPPPAATCAVRSRSSSTSCVIRSCRAANASSRCACDVRTVTTVSLSLRAVDSRRRAASSSVSCPRRSRQRQLPVDVPGRFMRPRCRARARPAPGRSTAPRATRARARSGSTAGSRGSRPVALALALRQRLEPAARGVGVVRRRVDDGLLLVVLESVRVARAGRRTPTAGRRFRGGRAARAAGRPPA